MKHIADPTRTIIIPLSGYVDVTGMEEIIDHPYFARLRFRRQLGFTCMVKPGGLHSRLEHSVGTLHTVRAMLERFRIAKGSDLYRALEVYALLHDVGHGPTSHELEYVLRDDHELIGRNLVEQMREAIAPYAHVDTVLELMRGEHELHELVRHKVFGADKLDYLERDAHHTFTEIAMNKGKIISCLQFQNGTLGIDEDAKEEIIITLTNYQRMYLEVYLHRTVKMFARIYQRTLMESIVDGSLDTAAVWNMIDPELYARLMHHPLMQRITTRQLLATVACFKIKGYEKEEHHEAKGDHAVIAIPEAELTVWSAAIHNATNVGAVERAIEQAADCPPHSVFLVQTDPLTCLMKLPEVLLYSRRSRKFRSLYDTPALSREDVLRRIRRAYYLCVMTTPETQDRVRKLDFSSFLNEKIGSQCVLL